MLAETKIKPEQAWKTAEPAEYTVYIPGVLLLLMALDSGWEISKANPIANWEPYGSVFLVTLRNQSNGTVRHLVVPQSPLIKKILEQHLPAMTQPA